MKKVIDTATWDAYVPLLTRALEGELVHLGFGVNVFSRVEVYDVVAVSSAHGETWYVWPGNPSIGVLYVERAGSTAIHIMHVADEVEVTAHEVVRFVKRWMRRSVRPANDG